MWMKILVLTLVMAGFVSAVLAESAESAETVGQPSRQEVANAILSQSEINLNDLFRLADLTNPQLEVDRAWIEARKGQAVQAGLYPNPELTLGVDEAFLSEPNPYKMRLELMQPLILGGRLGLAQEAAQFQMESAQYQLHLSRREVYRQVHRHWANQLYFREVETAFAELQKMAEHTLDLARARFESRSEPESHVTKALLEVYDLEVSLQRLRGERSRSDAETIAFLGGLPLPLERLSGSLDPDSDEPVWAVDHSDSTGNHPAVRAARMRVAAADAEARAARAARFPDLGVFLAFGQARPEDENYVEGGITVPVPLFHRNQGRVAETQSLIVMFEHEARRVESELNVALATAKQNHDLLHQQLETLETLILPAAERGLDQAQQAYRAGRLMFLELVDAQRTYADFRQRSIELKRDLAMAEADRLSLLGVGPYAQPGGIR